MNTLKSTILILASLALSGCFQVSKSQRSTAANSNDSGPGVTKTDYAMVSPETVISMLTTTLGLPASDASVQKVRANYFQLGGGDPSQGIPADSSFSALKGKLLLEVFIDGCSAGMQNATTKAKLFPKGTRDYDSLYLTVMGRTPSSEEKAELDFLHDSVSDTVAPAAICGAVLSSIEAVNRS